MVAFAKNRVKEVGSRSLGEKLCDDGFHQGEWLTYFRIRDHFVDVISVWRGRGAGAFYLAYFVNLLAEPETNTLGGYKIGHRPAKNPHTGFVWNLTSESDLESMFEDMCNFVDQEILPFFQGMNLDEFIAETKWRGSMLNISESVALGLSGRLEGVSELCDKDLAFIKEHPDRFDDAEGETIKEIVASLKIASEDQAEFDLLANGWREAKLLELGLTVTK